MSIKLTAFVVAYRNKKTPEEKENMLKEHIINKYVPYEKKVTIAKAISDNCYWKTENDINGNEYKVLHVDSAAKYMMSCMTVVDLYTDIQRQRLDGNILEDFNSLNELGIIDLIIKNI